MENVILKYIDSSLVIQTRTVDVISVRGFDDPDSIALFPPILNRYIDGYLKTQYIGFRRVITVRFGVVADQADRRFIFNWLKSNTRSVTYDGVDVGSEEIVVSHEIFEYEVEYLEESYQFKDITCQIVENAIRNIWSSYTPPSTVDIMYIKNKVKIEGTNVSPETFTTNAGKLLVDETGQSYPNISLLSYAVTVIVNGSPYQDAKINLVGDVVNSGANITFDLAVSAAGSDSGDGYCYADIILGLQARP